MLKSANQRWKESKTTLPFRDWITREKEKFINADAKAQESIILNVPLNDSVQSAINSAVKQSGLKKEIDKGKTFGISNTVLIVASVVIVGAIVYSVYAKEKS